jgi:predicted nuclease of restriction endonuclease-like (RecB) superfamily
MNVNDLTQYASLLGEIKNCIGQAQTRATISVNREMLALYWEIGRLITERQQDEGWGAGVLRKLAQDLKNELPGVKGFSHRNLKLMTQFYREYPYLSEIGQTVFAQLNGDPTATEQISQTPFAKIQNTNKKELSSMDAIAQTPSAQFNENRAIGEIKQRTTASSNVVDKIHPIVQQLVALLTWSHNVILIQSVKDLDTRLWYMQQTIEQGWSYSVLRQMIKSEAHLRQAKAFTNFEASLPAPQSDLAVQTLKDPYIFDFLTLDTSFRERELEAGLLRYLERFLLELGKGFSFVGRQYQLTVGEDEFYLDLLFYHLKLRCFVVIDLKVGPFKPDYAGKMNFYLNVVDDQLRHDTDNPTIGLILCQDKKKIIAEYALRGMKKPIGISEYELTRALPESLASALPTIEEIEGSLGQDRRRGK